MILLDTNVLSELTKTIPSGNVIDWLDKQARNSIWTTSVTILELRFGLRIMPAGKRRDQMEGAIKTMLTQKIGGRVASFDFTAAERTADLMAARQEAGRMVDLRDSMIAGIALSTNAALATGNPKHFEGLRVPIINPWVAR